MFNKRAGVFYRGIEPRGASLLKDFKNIPGKACLNGVHNNDAFVNVENQHTEKTLRMKLSYKKISHVFRNFPVFERH